MQGAGDGHHAIVGRWTLNLPISREGNAVGAHERELGAQRIGITIGTLVPNLKRSGGTTSPVADAFLVGVLFGIGPAGEADRAVVAYGTRLLVKSRPLQNSRESDLGAV
jgi:hypothetical protein